jgi:hypothetical protein
MNTYIIALELFLYAFSFYLLLRKGEMALLYLPVVFFCDTVTDNHFITAFAYYALISVILIRIITLNPAFISKNYFAGLLLLYFFVLMTKATNLVPERANVFNVIWFFFSLPLLVSVYKKYPREQIVRELSASCFFILCIFIVSVLAATWFHFNPYEMYGITGGLLFGNLYATDFNIIGFAIFMVLFQSLQKRKLIYLAVAVIALIFIALSMRRSVMSISALGVAVVTFIYLSKNLKAILPFTAVSAIVIIVVLFGTNFAASMMERYELRNLEERGLEEEQRYFEYNLLYEDVFHYKRYSALTGFDLFNSPGNYGGGKFYDRSLHGDITNIGHSSGLIGIALYFMMIATAFTTAWKAASGRNEKLVVVFCCIAFISYCLTGRYTQVGCMLMMFLVACIPLAPHEELVEDEEALTLETEEDDSPGSYNRRESVITI